MFDPSVIIELKRLILLKLGIVKISPSDCQHIALAISKSLNKSISKTTIKRLYGFAKVNYNFSKFTIHTLLEYVVTDETVLGKPNLLSIKDEAQIDWNKVYLKALQTTKATINGIIKNCTIPYELTISREFIKNDFQEFRQSNYSFTAIIGQANSGKSILLSHLIEDMCLKPKAKFQRDIVLFFDAMHIFNNDNNSQNLEFEIKKLLDMNSNLNLINMANQYHANTGNKLIIVIDSFYDLFTVDGYKNKIFKSLNSFLYAIENSAAVKVILSMRTYLWSRFYAQFRNSHYLKNKWYMGKHYQPQTLSNIPPFSVEEIKLVLATTFDTNNITINKWLMDQLQSPVYINLYYQLRDQYPPSYYQTGVIFKEIYTLYIQQHLYKSNYVQEKLILCKKFIECSNYGEDGFLIDKNNFLTDISLYKKAYMSLLATGIFIEEKLIIADVLKETISFSNPNIFIYFLFKELKIRFENRDIVNHILVNYHKKLRFELLQWLVFISIKNNNFNNIKSLIRLEPKIKEQHYLTLYIIENLKHVANENIKLRNYHFTN